MVESLDTQNYSDQVDEGWETVLGVDGINNVDVIDDHAMFRDQWRSGCVRKEEKVDFSKLRFLKCEGRKV